MITQRFNKLFDISPDLSNEKDKFVNRINQTAIKEAQDYYHYEKLFNYVCYEFGLNARDLYAERNRHNYSATIDPSLRSITGDDFEKTLKMLAVLVNFYEDENEQKGDEIESWIKIALRSSEVDLEIRWHNGMFYPAGDRKMDKELVEDVYDWLDSLPTTKKYYKEALLSYSKKNYNDLVGNLYNVLEDSARKLLNNRTVLRGNKEKLLSYLKLSGQWSTVLSKFIEFCDEYKRHASETQAAKIITPEEAEATLYLTGIFLRIALQRK